jgi:hypothetical protein
VPIEVKGGIDQAGVLERIGATLKSLRRTRQENDPYHSGCLHD